MVLFSFFGFIIAAPGAVVIKGFVTREKNGKISLAGPLTNIVLALIFFVFILLFGAEEGILGSFFSYGLIINSLLALFNLIPIPPFDGRAVYLWNKGIYIIVVIFAVLLFLSSYIIL